MTLRQKRLLHFWVSIPGALLFVLWIVSGTAMVYDSIRGGLHAFPKMKKRGDLRAVSLPPAALARDVSGDVSRIVLMTVGGRAYAQVTASDGTRLVDAASGRVLSPIDESTARALLAGYEGLEPQSVERVTSRGYEYKYGELPAWRGTFPNGRIIHIAASSGEVQSWSDREGMVIRAMYYWFHAFQFTDSRAVNAAIAFFAVLWAVAAVVSGLVLYRRSAAPAAAVLLAFFCATNAHASTSQRIVTLAPSCAEIVEGLGLGDALVGVTDFTDWPPRARTLPRVGSYVRINVESVAALRPDLVVGTDDGNPPADLRRLERLGLRLVTLNLRDFDSIQQSIKALGREVGREPRAIELVAEMRRVAACVETRTRKAARPRVLFAYGLSPIVSAGAKTFTDELLTMAGAASVTHDVANDYPRLTIESVVARAPDVIIVSSMNPALDEERWQTWLKRWPPTPAMRNGRVHLIDSSNIDRPSQRVVLGLRLLASTIHPSLFSRGECAATAL